MRFPPGPPAASPGTPTAASDALGGPPGSENLGKTCLYSPHPAQPRSASDKASPVWRVELVPPLSHLLALLRTLPDGEREVQCLVMFIVNHCDIHSLNSGVASSTAGSCGVSSVLVPDPRGPPLSSQSDSPRPSAGRTRHSVSRGSASPLGRSRSEGPPHPRPSKQRGGEQSLLVKLPAVEARKINIVRNHCNWDCEI